MPHFAVLFGKKNVVHAQFIISLKDITFKSLRNGVKFEDQIIFYYIAQQHFGGRSSMKRNNLIPQRYSFRGLVDIILAWRHIFGQRNHKFAVFCHLVEGPH